MKFHQTNLKKKYERFILKVTFCSKNYSSSKNYSKAHLDQCGLLRIFDRNT